MRDATFGCTYNCAMQQRTTIMRPNRFVKVKLSVDGTCRSAKRRAWDGIRAGPVMEYGARRMKKVVFVLAAAGLMSLAACSKQTPAENATDATANALDNAGENLEDLAENTTDANASEALSNDAENAHDAADAVAANKE